VRTGVETCNGRRVGNPFKRLTKEGKKKRVIHGRGEKKGLKRENARIKRKTDLKWRANLTQLL